MKSHINHWRLWQIIKRTIAVIAILFVVAAVLFPVFVKGRSYGPRGSCESNLKQLSIGILQYVQDYDENFPCGLFDTVKSKRGVGWAGQIYLYEKSTGVFRCPTVAADSESFSNIDYAFNFNMANIPNGEYGLTAPAHSIVLFEVSGANADITLADEGISIGTRRFSPAGDGTYPNIFDGGSNVAQYATGDIGDRPAILPGKNGAWLPGRHQGAANYAMADGHVKWLAGPQVSGGRNAKTASSTQTGYAIGSAAGTESSAYAATFSVR